MTNLTDANKKFFCKVWLDKLTAANCKAMHWFWTNNVEH